MWLVPVGRESQIINLLWCNPLLLKDVAGPIWSVFKCHGGDD